ncbi:hypothetical protein BVRB_7g162050 [Beta vulgaris subsp. vulgaris]|nr:hypothetical protein BVRB_7g162050 [Beta vulgaris subsp. vulgaris]
MLKVVGDGTTTEIWKDPWVPGLPNSSVFPYYHKDENTPTFVYELRMNRERLTTYFNEWEREAILKIPLPRYPCEDQWSWKLTKHGEFTVRSAYYAELHARKDGRASNSTTASHGIWTKLWNAKVPL